MRIFTLAVFILFSLESNALSACQDTSRSCSTGSILTGGAQSHVCDIVCGSSTCSGGTFASCDQCGGGSNLDQPDGKCTICDRTGGTVYNTTITGTAGADVICGDNGEDTIDGNGDADRIAGGDGNDLIYGDEGADIVTGDAGDDILYGNDGADTLTGDGGDNFVVGGSNDDTLWGSTGDDVLLGESGDDILITAAGSDYANGGTGNDILTPTAVWSSTIADDALGKRFCGGDGNDTLVGNGPRHVCLDAGDGSDTCRYSFAVTSRSAESTDLGTMIGCETITSGYEPNSARQPDCGCPD